jgi:hypothetical protein
MAPQVPGIMVHTEASQHPSDCGINTSGPDKTRAAAATAAFFSTRQARTRTLRPCACRLAADRQAAGRQGLRHPLAAPPRSAATAALHAAAAALAGGDARVHVQAITSNASTAVTSATHSSAGSYGAGSEPAEPGRATAAAKHFEIERTKYAAPVQPFEPYDAWRLGPPVPGCQDERIEAAQAIAEYRTPSDPAVGAPREAPGVVLLRQGPTNKGSGVTERAAWRSSVKRLPARTVRVRVACAVADHVFNLDAPLARVSTVKGLHTSAEGHKHGPRPVWAAGSVCVVAATAGGVQRPARADRGPHAARAQSKCCRCCARASTWTREPARC